MTTIEVFLAEDERRAISFSITRAFFFEAGALPKTDRIACQLSGPLGDGRFCIEGNGPTPEIAIEKALERFLLSPVRSLRRVSTVGIEP